MTYKIFTTLALLLISTALHAQQDTPVGETEVTARPGSVAFCLGHCTHEKCDASEYHFQECMDRCSRFRGMMHSCAAAGADRGYKNSHVKADAKYRPCPAGSESIKPLSDVTPGDASSAPADSARADTPVPDGVPEGAEDGFSADQVNLSANDEAAPDDAATSESLPDDSASSQGD